MPRVHPETETFARIKVFGIGGSGSNALDHMIRSRIHGVDFVAVNTDAQDLHHSLAPRKVHLGKSLTRGLGAGMDPFIGRQAAEENREELSELVKDTDMVFIAGGFGGGTCTGASPVVADCARSQGALTVAVITKPFAFEGSERSRIADEGLARLKETVDAMIIIPNDRLLGVIDKKTSFRDAFARCDDILRQAVQGISDLITLPGIINVDFADVRAVMANAGSAIMGVGRATGENRAVEAAQQAISSPLLDLSINGARGLLFSIAGGDDLTMWEVNEAARTITEPISKDARVIFGAVKDDRLKKGEVKITVVASGFGETALPIQQKAQPVFSSMQKREEKEKKTLEPEEPSEEWDAIPAFLRRSKK